MNKYNFLIDTHTHIDGKDFDADRESVIQNAIDNNVKYMINAAGTDILEGAKRAIFLASKCDNVFASAGQHPHDADTPLEIEMLYKLAMHPRVVAIGETGLDFYKDWSDFDKQKILFKEHINIAKKVNKPLIVHCRKAGNEAVSILEKLDASNVGGVFHCFSESIDIYNKIAEMNFLVSFTGVITFKNANKIREVVKQIPLSKIMLETDAPYMAPEPFRGTRCEPMYTLWTAKALAKIKECTLEEVIDTTTRNAVELFKLKL
ncbi:MAG: TatD family hydrolase [Bdellovibrionota bacterium]